MRQVNKRLCAGWLLALVLGTLAGSATAGGKAVPPELPGSSLYQLDSKWQTDDGRKTGLAGLRGKIRLLTLFFGHCESSCPMLLSKLKTLEIGLTGDSSKRFGFVLVSLDPARDDAASLARFRKDAGLAREAWTLLRGNEADTRELAMMLNAAYRESGKNGGVEHDAVIVLLDAEGRILNRYDGKVTAATLAADLASAMRGGVAGRGR
jgi:protein SCO1/2